MQETPTNHSSGEEPEGNSFEEEILREEELLPSDFVSKEEERESKRILRLRAQIMALTLKDKQLARKYAADFLRLRRKEDQILNKIKFAKAEEEKRKLSEELWDTRIKLLDLRREFDSLVDLEWNEEDEL